MRSALALACPAQPSPGLPGPALPGPVLPGPALRCSVLLNAALCLLPASRCCVLPYRAPCLTLLCAGPAAQALDPFNLPEGAVISAEQV